MRDEAPPLSLPTDTESLRKLLADREATDHDLRTRPADIQSDAPGRQAGRRPAPSVPRGPGPPQRRSGTLAVQPGPARGPQPDHPVLPVNPRSRDLPRSRRVFPGDAPESFAGYLAPSRHLSPLHLLRREESTAVPGVASSRPSRPRQISARCAGKLRVDLDTVHLSPRVIAQLTEPPAAGAEGHASAEARIVSPGERFAHHARKSAT